MGGAALAAPALPPSAQPALDAALIQECARYLEIERMMRDPLHPEHHLQCDRMSVWPEYQALEHALYEAEPRTVEGWAAVASVALLCDGAIEGATWDDGEETRLAWKVLAHLAGPAVVQEEERRAAERSQRAKAAMLRVRETEAARPAPEPYQDTRTPQQKVDDARRLIAVGHAMLADAEAELTLEVQA